MTELEAMRARHSVRAYQDSPIPPDVISALNAEIDDCNRESGLNIQLIINDDAAFGGLAARYGRFSGARNYVALVGDDEPAFDEKSGYYGERIVLKAQMLGLNTCWAALTFSKRKCKAKIRHGERLGCCIAVGYGVTQGTAHKSKSIEKVCESPASAPDWFISGVEAALLAPTALNQQRFMFAYNDGAVSAKALKGPCTRIDLGIVKYHFELAAARNCFKNDFMKASYGGE